MSGDGSKTPAPEPAAPRQRPDQAPGRTTRDWDDWASLPRETERPSPLPVFLERDLYRRRRLMDAARLLPAFGTALLLLPMLWARDQGTATGAVYTFLVWFGLIAFAALLARRLSEPLRDRKNRAGRSSGEP